MKEVAKQKLKTKNVKIDKNIVGQLYEDVITKKWLKGV